MKSYIWTQWYIKQEEWVSPLLVEKLLAKGELLLKIGETGEYLAESKNFWDTVSELGVSHLGSPGKCMYSKKNQSMFIEPDGTEEVFVYKEKGPYRMRILKVVDFNKGRPYKECYIQLVPIPEGTKFYSRSELDMMEEARPSRLEAIFGPDGKEDDERLDAWRKKGRELWETFANSAPMTGQGWKPEEYEKFAKAYGITPELLYSFEPID